VWIKSKLSAFICTASLHSSSCAGKGGSKGCTERNKAISFLLNSKFNKFLDFSTLSHLDFNLTNLLEHYKIQVIFFSRVWKRMKIHLTKWKCLMVPTILIPLSYRINEFVWKPTRVSKRTKKGAQLKMNLYFW